MADRRKTWVASPPRAPKQRVPDAVKIELTAKAERLIEEYLKPNHVKPPRAGAVINYPIDFFAKWRGRSFYIGSTYASPGSHAVSPTFEEPFARMEYAGNELFNLSFKRHTGQWIEIYSGLTIDECLAAIRDEPHFLP